MKSIAVILTVIVLAKGKKRRFSDFKDASKSFLGPENALKLLKNFPWPRDGSHISFKIFLGLERDSKTL